MGGLQDVLLLPDKKRTDFSWHEIEVSMRIAFHAIKNITSEILSEISLQRKSRQTENSVGDIPLYISQLIQKNLLWKTRK